MSENEQGTTEQGTEDVGGLRKQLEETRNELKSLKQERRQRAYADAGIPEGARDIFDKTYDGELSVEALREFGTSKGFALADLGTGGGEQATQTSEAQQVAQQGQARLDAVDAARLPNDQPDIKTQIAEAMAAGDWDKSRALKHQLLDEHNRARRQANAIA
jgi:hypothetical protein